MPIQKIIYRNECLLCHAQLSDSLDYETHIKLSHEDLYEKIKGFTTYKSKHGMTVFASLEKNM